MNRITDFFQQELRVGDRIVYPMAIGSSGVGLQESVIERIDELVPDEPYEPTCRLGYRYSERLRPPVQRTSLELPMRYDPALPNRRGGHGEYVYDETKLFKLRVLPLDHNGQPGKRTAWIKNVDRVIRAPEAVQF